MKDACLHHSWPYPILCHEALIYAHEAGKGGEERGKEEDEAIRPHATLSPWPIPGEEALAYTHNYLAI